MFQGEVVWRGRGLLHPHDVQQGYHRSVANPIASLGSPLRPFWRSWDAFPKSHSPCALLRSGRVDQTSLALGPTGTKIKTARQRQHKRERVILLRTSRQQNKISARTRAKKIHPNPRQQPTPLTLPKKSKTTLPSHALPPLPTSPRNPAHYTQLQS